MPSPNPAWPSDATILTLSGTTDDPTFLDYVPKGIGPNSTPTLEVRRHRWEQRLYDDLAPLMVGRVFDEGALKIGVVGGDYILGATVKTFAGATNQSVTDDDDNYVYIDAANSLVINTTGFPVDLTTFVPLATVTAAGGAMTIADHRSRLLFTVSNAVGTFANAALSNLASVAINTALVSDTDNTDDLGTAVKAWKNAFLGGALIFGGASRAFATTLACTTPAAARVVTVPDPLGDDTFALLAAAQTLANKTLADAKIHADGITLDSSGAKDLLIQVAAIATADRTLTLLDPGADDAFVYAALAQDLYAKTLITPTIASFVNAPHDHADAAGGDVLTQTSHGTGKYCPAELTGQVAGTLTVGATGIRFVAGRAGTITKTSGSVKTAPTGDSIIVDTRINGASIHSAQVDMVNIVAAGNNDTSEVENAAYVAGNVIDIEVEQVGSGTAGADLTVTLHVLQALEAAA